MDSLGLKEFHSFFSRKRVFVTGHTGFKGSWLVYILKLFGAELAGFSLIPTESNIHFNGLKLENDILNYYDDIRNYNSLRDAIYEFRPEIIIHLAAQSLVKASYYDPIQTFTTNIVGGMNLLEVVRNYENLKSVVFVTSDKCYENKEWIWGYRENDQLGGIDPYSASKASTEIIFSSYARSYFMHRPTLGVATARAGNVIGGGDWSKDRLIPDCFKALINDEIMVIRNPNSTRPWQHVLEPLSGYLLLAKNLYLYGSRFSGAWNFGPPIGGAKTVNDVIQAIKFVFPNIKIKFEESNQNFHEANLLQLNSDKALQLLKWQNRWTIDESIEATLSWYSNVKIKNENMLEVSKEQIYKYFGGNT